MTAMAKTRPTKAAKPDKDPEKDSDKKAEPPSRAGYASTYLPKALYEHLEIFGEEQERSAAYFVRKAVEAYLVFLRTGKYPDTPNRD